MNAIVDGLVAAGHSRESIIVWDKSLGGIKEAGYTTGEGYQLKSIPPRDGYDPKAVISAPFLGNLIWGDFEYIGSKGQSPLLSDTENTSSVSHLSKIVANEVTKIINLPVLSDSVRNGVSGCLYNVTIPNIDNWRRFGVAPDFGASSIPEIYSDPHIGPKVVLNLMDGLLAQYAGGPESQPGYAFPFATLYASKDPVAIDAIVAPAARGVAQETEAAADQAPRRTRDGGGAVWPRECRSLAHRDPRRRAVKAILKSVSRSFYLTIRFLPRPLREPVSLAYLLARATDTIADTAPIPAANRLTTLLAFARVIAGESEFSSVAEPLREFAARQSDPAERTLIENLRSCIDRLAAMEPADRRRHPRGSADDRQGAGARCPAVRRPGGCDFPAQRDGTG